MNKNNDNNFFTGIANWIRSGSIGPLVLMAGMFFAGWWIPFALMLLIKLDVLHPEKWFTTPTYMRYNSTPGAKSPEQREQEYKNISQNLSSVSIDYFAGMVGVPFETAMRDIQKMILEGAFGPDAYIDYTQRRLIIRSGAGETEPASAYKPINVTVNNSGTTTPQTTAAPVQEVKQEPKQETKTEEAPKASKERWKTRSASQEIFKSQGALLWVGIVLLAIGGIAGIAAASDILAGYVSASFFDLMFPIVLAVTGGGMLATRFLRIKRARRITSYLQIIGDRGSVTFDELARAVGESESTVKKDIDVMLEKKLLGDEAYMDMGAGRLIIFRAAREEPQTEEDAENRYNDIVKEIRQLNDEIDDPMVSEKIGHIETLTAKIFKVVEDKPEKLPEIKSFMSYYLPTTLKLLRSYRDFERQGVGGENIEATKERIEKILDTLVSGFSQQLDQLFRTDAMDISSDIDVLETMMKRDGLQKDESGFGGLQAGV